MIYDKFLSYVFLSVGHIPCMYVDLCSQFALFNSRRHSILFFVCLVGHGEPRTQAQLFGIECVPTASGFMQSPVWIT